MESSGRIHPVLRNSLILLFAGILAGLAAPSAAPAQFFEEMGEAAKDAAEDEARRQTRRAARKAVRCAVGEIECIRDAKRDGRDVVVTDESGDPVSEERADEAIAAADGGAGAAPGPADANYDFEEAPRTIFATDFGDDALGDFPGELEFRGGNMEVAAWGGERWLRSTGDGKVAVRLDEPLPERFTITFDAHVESGISDGIRVVPEIADEALRNYERHYFLLGHRHVSGVKTGGTSGLPESTSGDDQIGAGVATARIMVDGSKAKVYVGTHRVANIPNAELARGDRILFVIPGRPDDPSFVRNIRIGGEHTGLYPRLEQDGEVTVRGLEFDEGSATLKPGSAEALAEIATMLGEHPELDLVIQAHTDVPGGFDANMDLSRARAEAIRSHLVENHGIPAERLRAMGLGSIQPVVEGDGPEAREKNERIVLSGA